MEGKHDCNSEHPDNNGKRMRGGFVSENNLRHLTLESVCDHQTDMNNDETAKEDQTDEVETARCLPAA